MKKIDPIDTKNFSPVYLEIEEDTVCIADSSFDDYDPYKMVVMSHDQFDTICKEWSMWKDISSAPKDGTMVIVAKFIKNPTPYRPAVAYITEAYWDEETDNWDVRQGHHVKDPTHWMKYTPPKY